jgi:hypothetical protein
MGNLEAIQVFMEVSVRAEGFVPIAANLADERALDNRLGVLLGDSAWTDVLEILLIASIDLLQDFCGSLPTCTWCLDQFSLQRPTTHDGDRAKKIVILEA